MVVAAMDKKREIAIGIALQTRVLKTCPIHDHWFCENDELIDDEDISRAYSVAVELVRQHEMYAEEFHHDPHALTELLTQIISTAPDHCPDCRSTRTPSAPGRGRYPERRAVPRT